MRLQQNVDNDPFFLRYRNAEIIKQKSRSNQNKRHSRWGYQIWLQEWYTNSLTLRRFHFSHTIEKVGGGGVENLVLNIFCSIILFFSKK